MKDARYLRLSLSGYASAGSFWWHAVACLAYDWNGGRYYNYVNHLALERDVALDTVVNTVNHTASLSAYFTHLEWAAFESAVDSTSALRPDDPGWINIEAVWNNTVQSPVPGFATYTEYGALGDTRDPMFDITGYIVYYTSNSMTKLRMGVAPGFVSVNKSSSGQPTDLLDLIPF